MEQLKPAPRATAIMVFLLVLNILNMVDRNLITSFGSVIIADLELSDSQFGLLTGLIFAFFYSVMGLFMGALADRVNRPRLIAAGLVLWSALTAVSGTAKNFLEIGLARLFIGVGESAMTPSAMSMLSDLYPRTMRGTATGFYYLGVPLGAGGSFVVAGLLGPAIGWRNCFYLLGGLGLVLALLLLAMRDPDRGAMELTFSATDRDERPDEVELTNNWRHMIGEVMAVIKSVPALAWTMIGAVFLHLPLGAGQFVIVWLERERGFAVGEITVIYGLLYIVFGTAGTFLGGILSDLYQKRYRGGRVRFLALLMVFMMPLIVSFRFVSPDSPLFFIGMASAMFTVSAFYGPAFSTVQDLTPVRLRGVMTGLLLVACNLLGLGLGAVITGYISDILADMEVFEPLTKALLVARSDRYRCAAKFYAGIGLFVQNANSKNRLDRGINR